MAILLDRYIESTAAIRGGRPCIAGTRITVADLVVLHIQLSQPLLEIAQQYDLSLASVYAAMAYYYDHRGELDQSLEQDAAIATVSKQGHRSILQEKLTMHQE